MAQAMDDTNGLPDSAGEVSGFVAQYVVAIQ
jgi:hypothetical protein